MEVRTCRHAVAVALLVALAGCTDDDDSDGPGNFPNDGAGSAQEDTLAALDRLIADADAYRFTAYLLREDAALATIGDSPDEPLITDLFAGFERATDGDMAALLAETRSVLVEQATVGCTIDGSYDGVDFDDSPDEENADGEFSEYVSAGDALLVSDETRALGALRSDSGNPEIGPFYEWDLPDELDRTTVGILSVEVPGDVFPGVGTLTLPATPLAGVTADGPLTVESTIRWEPTDDGGTITVGLVVEGEPVVNEDGEREREGFGISCVTADDGEFRLPDATLARLPEAVDAVFYSEIERVRTAIVPMGETIVFLTGFTSRALFGSE